MEHEDQHGDIDRRSFLNGAGRFAAGALTVGAIFEMMRPSHAWAQQAAKETHPASARVLDRLRTRFTFQISVDVATMEQGLAVAGAALAGGVNIVEMGTPLLKNQGVSNVVPAFRQQVSRGAPAGRHEDHGWRCLRGARRLCGRRQHRRFPRARRCGYGEGDLRRARRVQARRPRTAAARLRRHHGAAPGPGRAGRSRSRFACSRPVWTRVGIHLQADARRADPTLIESDYLGDVARAIFERVGKAAPVQVVGGLSVAQAKSLAQAGLRAFVISGNLGQPDTRARYDLPPDQIQRYVAGFIAEVSRPK